MKARVRRRNSNIYTKPVTAYLTDSVKIDLMKKAYQYRTSVSSVIRLAIDNYLKEHPIKEIDSI